MNEDTTHNTDNFSFQRLKTRTVKIGASCLGGNNPILVQSMTNTNSLDTKATVEQCIRIIDAGADLIRITAQGVAEAENLKNIKAELRAKGYSTPLSADIHYNPKAAEIAAQYVEKVRINPGNYAEKNTNKEYSDEEYLRALEKTAIKLQSLIAICKKHKTVIRIGVNHGSLSNRILSKYGNTPSGMVESAIEFVKIFEEAQFYDLIISLKSSNVLTMVQANRMLASRMKKRENIYPIHLGVTEAGNGIEGRQKSIAGIATLLSEGIGDTIRVSLTEAPENEIIIAKKLQKYFERNISVSNVRQNIWFNPFIYHKRQSVSVENIGGKNKAVVVLSNPQAFKDKASIKDINQNFTEADFEYIGNRTAADLFSGKKFIQDFSVWEKENTNCSPLLKKNELLNLKHTIEQLAFIQLTFEELNTTDCRDALKKVPLAVLVLNANSNNPVSEWREAFYVLHKEQINIPVILNRKLDLDGSDSILIEATQMFSALLLDGFGDGIWIQNEGNIHSDTINLISFGILQSCRMRLTQTDYIACPSCGRTLFNIEESLEEIKIKTKHLKHLKIAIMGCLVNGLGEMADADYGYVGSGIGKVNLYKGKVLIHKNVQEKDAAEALVSLIKAEGDWL